MSIDMTVVRWIWMTLLAVLPQLAGSAGDSPVSAAPEGEAKVACERFVSASLQAPLSAKFPSHRELVALSGSADHEGKSAASRIARVMARSFSRAGFQHAVALDRQLNFITADDMLTMKDLAARGDFGALEKILAKSLSRRFSDADYVVAGYVDSQNVSGAMLRTQFLCLVKRDSAGEWRRLAVAGF